MNPKNNSTYFKKLKTASGDLKQMSDRLFDMALHLALTGKWKEWEKSMPIGTRITFNEGMLLKVNDNLVKRFTKLRIELSETAEQIKSRLVKKGFKNKPKLLAGISD